MTHAKSKSRQPSAIRPTQSPRAPLGGSTISKLRALAGQSVWQGALLLLLTCVAYLPVRNDGFIWDDDAYITLNATLRSAEGLREMWLNPRSLPQYYPLTFTVFWVEYQLWGLAPLGYHLVNVALHGLCVVLLWRLLRGWQVPGAWLAAALFAVHPVCVESVAWVTELKNVLSLALALASVGAYFRFAPWQVDPQSDAEPQRVAVAHPRWFYYGLSLGLFALALASKTAVTPLPAVLLVICWWKRGRIGVRDVWPLVPFFALSIVTGLLTRQLELDHVLAVGPDWDYSPLMRVLIASRALCFYLGKLVWPYPVMLFYPRWNIATDDWVQYLYPLAVLAAFASLWLARHRVGRGPLAAAIIFAGVLAPALGFFNIYFMRFSYVADHFQYHACPAILALLAAIAMQLAARMPAEFRRLAIVGAAGWLLVLGAITFQQVRAYQDRETLYRDTLAKNPRCWNAWLNLGAALDERGQLHEALEMYGRAVELKPDDHRTHVSLAHILIRMGEERGFAPGKLDEAIQHLRDAIELAPRDADAHRNMGFALITAQRPDEAMRHFDLAIEESPEFPEAHYGRGSLLLATKDLPQAQAAFERAVRARPEYADAEYGLAIVLARQNQVDAAIEHLHKVLRIDQNYVEAHDLLGDLLVRQADFAGAAREYGIVAQQAPGNLEIRLKLGTLLLEQGNAEQAAAYFEQALRLDPSSAAARAGLQRSRSIQRPGDPRP